MSNYNYSELNNIIALQYAKKKNNNINNNWFLEETIKYAKGYTKTDNFFSTIINKLGTSSTEISDIDDIPLYLDKL